MCSPQQPVQQQQASTELPEWAKPYAKDILAKGQALTDVNQNPYQQYTQPRVAGFSPMQQQAMQNAQGMSVTPQTGEATAGATMAGLGGMGVAGQANPYGFQNQVGGYMNPYLQMSLAPQLAEANRQYDIGATKQQSAATQAGAFGGSREAIMAAENERNRNQGLNSIIGQGYNTFTMLQLAQATAILANNGIKNKPQLVMATQDAMSRQQVPVPNAPPEDLGYAKDNIEVIRKALVGVTTEGTSARVFAGAPYVSAGKTGTAQAVTIGQKDKYDARKMEEHQRDHALYMAFAPAEDPQIALAVVVENAGFGAEHAAPIARRVFDYWVSGLYPSEQDIAAARKGQAAAPIGKQRLAAEVAWPPVKP
jgi:cell division protein FtsI/penicillin-binding protein 2